MSFGERCQLFQHFKIDRNLVFGVGERFHTWTNRRIADGALTVFVPEVILGLKWKMKRAFTIPCCIAWCIFLLKMAHYFFAVVTNAPITYYGTVCIVLSGLMWSIVMELKQELKEYLLGFPQEYWLVPCSNSSRYNKVFRFIWLVGVVLGTIFLLMIKWG